MDLLIPNSWLKKFLDTKANPTEIAKYLSLCGPSVERTKKHIDGDFIFNVEVTTNRVDTASILGIAREATSILPRFNIKANLKNYKPQLLNYKFKNKVKYLDVKVDEKLCPRFTAVKINGVTVKESPKEIKTLLEKVDVSPINNIVDVSNFIMHELGQPVHTFDYDKIIKHKMILRQSRNGEHITTLDGKELKLRGGDIVIEDGDGKLIDLCGIMGGLNSAIDNNTKTVLLFVQNYNPYKIRKTSISLGQRSEAAVLFEKGLDSENIKPAILSAIEMIERLSGGKAESEILDIYPTPYKVKALITTKGEIDKIIGIEISAKDMTSYLTNLGFGVKWNKNILSIEVPSYRANDINIKEDIAEEIARIYGYHNLPILLMTGALPAPKVNPEFELEKKIKTTLLGLGAVEVYNLSLVDKGLLKLKNPLGSDTAFLRNNLKNSLIEDIKLNPQEKGYIHMFELANIYFPHKNDLPEERLTLAGIIKRGSYRENKGIVETLLDELNIDYSTKLIDGKDYLPNQKLDVYSNKIKIGEYGNLENGQYYYEFNIQYLINSKKIIRKYKEIPKYPPQIEDLTLIIPNKTFIGDVVKVMRSTSKQITKITLVDTFENAYTFNIEYQHPEKTLTDKEVEETRVTLLNHLKTGFGVQIKP